MDQKNLILAIVFSVVILIGFQFYVELYAPKPPAQPEQPAQQEETADLPQIEESGTAASPGSDEEAPLEGVSRELALADTPRLPIDSDRLSGSLALTSGRLDDLILPQYRESQDADSPAIVLLSPPRAPNPYYANFGWTGADPLAPKQGV